jgi:hypothetical protein
MRGFRSLFLLVGSCSVFFAPNKDAYLEKTDLLCSDGVDNDGVDGTDCDDRKCARTKPCDPCGNNILDAGEGCDDGNQDVGDNCDPNCQVPGCGNGFLAPNESCLTLLTSISANTFSEFSGIALGDFQGDGALDLAIGDFGTPSVSVIFNQLDLDGQPAFSSVSLPDMSSVIPNIATGDINNDGLADILAPVKFSNAIGVLTSTGGDDFLIKEHLADVSVVNETFGIAVADLNLDSALDVCTSNFLSNNVSCFINDGLGGFDPLTPLLQSMQPGTTPQRLALGDINGDNIVDMATVNAGTGDVSVALSLGVLSYAPSFLAPDLAGAPKDLAIGDLNQDGFGDLIVTDTNSNQVLLFFGERNLLSLKKVLTSPSPPGSVSLHDLDLDGDLDIVVGSSLLGGQVHIFFNQGQGVFLDALVVVSVADLFLRNVVVGDLNKDGFPDLVANDIASGLALFFLNKP